MAVLRGYLLACRVSPEPEHQPQNVNLDIAGQMERYGYPQSSCRRSSRGQCPVGMGEDAEPSHLSRLARSGPLLAAPEPNRPD